MGCRIENMGRSALGLTLGTSQRVSMSYIVTCTSLGFPKLAGPFLFGSSGS